jgi:hypothetical protein
MEKRKIMARPKKYTTEYLNKLANDLMVFMENEKNYWLKDFCIANKFPSQDLSRFAKENKEFCEALKKAKDLQESKFVKMGLDKKNNPAFVIFALKNIANWRDKREDTVTIQDLSQIKKDLENIFE